MKNKKKSPDRIEEPHVPEINPNVPPEPVIPIKYPEITPSEIPEPSHPIPEVPQET